MGKVGVNIISIQTVIIYAIKHINSIQLTVHTVGYQSVSINGFNWPMKHRPRFDSTIMRILCF